LGGVIFMVPEIHTRYHSRTSLKSLWRQYYRYGLWKVRVLQKHPRQMQVRQFIPPLFVLSLLGSAFLSFFISWFWVVVVLIAGIYILASLVASCILACHKGWRYFPLLPIVFAVLHIGYGVGFLLGLFKFAKRWNDKRGQVPDYPYLTNHR